MSHRLHNRPDTSALRHIGLDAVLSAGELEQLALHTDVVDVPAGEVLFRAGEYPRQLLVVVDGYVDVTGADGRERIDGPGTRIGGIELATARRMGERAVARTACTLVVIFGPALLWALRSPERRATAGPLLDWLGATAPALAAAALAN